MENAPNIYHPKINRLIQNIEKVIVGKRKEIALCITAMLAKGHVLLEDVPGVGKTLLVKAIATSLEAEFKRIQFTPDLLPSDVTGTSIFNPKELTFEYQEGPLMANIVLADEINRTSPKTQSALLEAMEEGNVTVDGDTKKLPSPFFVLATQNPIEYEGTYSLPEAQLDRFLFKLTMGYPTLEEEFQILSLTNKEQPIESLTPVLCLEDILSLQQEAMATYVSEGVKKYILEIVRRTRNHRFVKLGVSPRGSIALMKAAQAFAFICGRDYALPDDVKAIAPYTLSHRMMLNNEAKFNGIAAEQIIKEILQQVKVPVEKV